MHLFCSYLNNIHPPSLCSVCKDTTACYHVMEVPHSGHLITTESPPSTEEGRESRLDLVVRIFPATMVTFIIDLSDDYFLDSLIDLSLKCQEMMTFLVIISQDDASISRKSKNILFTIMCDKEKQQKLTFDGLQAANIA